jgi:hypothetical protein
MFIRIDFIQLNYSSSKSVCKNLLERIHGFREYVRFKMSTPYFRRLTMYEQHKKMKGRKKN